MKSNIRWPLRFLSLMVFLALAACGKSPEQAKKELVQKNIPLTEQALVQQSKKTGSEENAGLLVAAGVNPNARQDNGLTALMAAALSGQEDTVSSLLDKGADANAVAGNYSVLLAAVYGGNEKIVRRLVAKGADVNYRNPDGKTPLRAARELNREELVGILEKAGARQ